MSTPTVKKYDFNLGPGKTYNLPASGAYLRLISCSSAVSVQLDSGATLESITVGQGLKETDFGALTLINPSNSAAVSGVLLVATAEFVDTNLTGSLNVTVKNFGGTVNSIELYSVGQTNVVTQAFGLNASRRYLFVQNKHAVDDLLLAVDLFSTPDEFTGIRLAPGETYEPTFASQYPIRVWTPNDVSAVVLEG